MTEIQWLVIGVSAVAAGMVNALAGGGTLITFPVLLAVGIPPVIANVTNTVALCPGYLAATLAQHKELHGQQRRLYFYIPAGIFGGTLGGFLLLNTEEQAFRALVPFLILFASCLLAVQDYFRAWLLHRTTHPHSLRALEIGGVVLGFLAAIYGGYFGAGVSVIVLAVLGLTLDEPLNRLNALKQVIAFSINSAAALFFISSGTVNWPVAFVMAAGALLGGALGGRLSGRIQPSVLRWTIVTIGFGVGFSYLGF